MNTFFILYFLIFLIGACIGSFLNVVIYRLPLMLFSQWTAQAKEWLSTPYASSKEKKLSLALPRSFCPHCHTTIPFYRNIPLLSFIFQKKCAHCKHPIAWRYFIVETLTTISVCYAFYHFGFSVQFCFALVFISLIIPIIYIDYQYQIIPDTLSTFLIWTGLLGSLQNLIVPIDTAIYGTISGYLSLAIFTKLYAFVSKKQAMGEGDFKLFAGLGAWFGYAPLPFLLFIASCCGVLIGGLYLYLSKKNKDTKIPFGPFLGAAGLFYLFHAHTV